MLDRARCTQPLLARECSRARDSQLRAPLPSHRDRRSFWLSASGFCMIAYVIGAVLIWHLARTGWEPTAQYSVGLALLSFGRVCTSFAQVRSLDLPRAQRPHIPNVEADPQYLLQSLILGQASSDSSTDQKSCRCVAIVASICSR